MEYFVGCYARISDTINVNGTNASYKKDIQESFIVDGPDVVHEQSTVDVLITNAKSKMESKYGPIEKDDFTLMSFTRMLPEESNSTQ